MISSLERPLLMGCSLGELRAKLGDPGSPLAPWWRHFLTMAREDPIVFSPYTVLAALVTGEECDRELARQSFLRFVELKGEGEASLEAQYHTHVVAAPVGRWAIFYDWLADAGLFTPEEDARIRQALLDFAFLFPMQQAQSRMLSFDNQVMSNAFGASVVGYVFGVKRGDNALARRMYSVGLSWLQELIGLLPKGGYSPEGSTYHMHVVMPMVTLTAAFIEETTGLPLFAQGLPPASRPVRQLLETSLKMIGPGGLLPAWDAYGYEYISTKCGLVYLARRTGCAEPLNVIRALNVWYRSTLPAWEIDDRLWTLVWWPEAQAAQSEPAFPSWLIPEVAGALQDKARKIRLFQYWDECGGVPSSGRSQVDPNAVTLEAFQSPLLVDGYGHPDRAVLPMPIDDIVNYVGERTVETIREYIYAAWGEKPSVESAALMSVDGSVGMANSLVFDDEGWYVPLAPRTGKGEALHDAGPLKVLHSDATCYYTDRYDVTGVRRSSALINGKYALVTDRVTAKSPHRLTWQAYVRREADLLDGGASLFTPEKVRCDIIPLQPGETTLTPVDGYPRLGDSRSVLLKHTVAPAAEHRLDVALIPQSCLRPVADLTAGWTRKIGASSETVSLDTAYLTDPIAPREAARLFTRTVTLTREAGTTYFFKLDTASNQVQVRVNGAEVAPVLMQPQGVWKGSACFLPWLFDVTGALQDGENTIEITTPYFKGETVLGPAGLYAETAPLPVNITRKGETAFIVTCGEEVDELLVENTTGLVSWAGGETDARYALASGNTLAAVAVTKLALPALNVESLAPVDLAWSPEQTALTGIIFGTEIDLRWPDAHLRVEWAGCLQVHFQGAGAHTLKMALPSRCLVMVNGENLGQHGGQDDAELMLELAPAQATATVAATVDELYALAERAGDQAAPSLLAALGSDDWRLQLAAADLIGQFGIREAVLLLLERFAEGEAELPYPQLKMWWRWSKMLRAEGPEGPDPNAGDPLVIKRWRVKRAVATALGKIGDQRAVAPLETALARCDDFFPVTSQLAVALGRLGSPSSIPILERHYHHAEANTRQNARLALALLKGEIDRATFERKVGKN